MDSVDYNPVWRPLAKDGYGFLSSISSSVAQLEAQFPDLLTSLRTGPKLILTSDYSGYHSGATAEIYSFLLADAIYLWIWEEMRQRLRKQYLPDQRRMSFKGLNDRYKQKALVPFLRIANSIPGLLLIVVIQKGIRNLFGLTADDITRSGITRLLWKKQTMERLLRIGALAGVLIACMSAPGQELLWVTDEDDIVANDDRLRDACAIISRIHNNLLSHPIGRFRFGSTRCDDGSLALEDLATIPDLVSGALGELSPLLFAINLDSPPRSGNPFKSIDCSRKSEIIMNWIADGTRHTLRKLIVEITKRDDVSNVRCTTFKMSAPRPEFLWNKEASDIFKGLSPKER